METERRLKVSSNRLVKPGIKPATPGLQGKRFIHYTTAAPKLVRVVLHIRKGYVIVIHICTMDCPSVHGLSTEHVSKPWYYYFKQPTSV